jgi:hypothetical protein
MDQALLKEATRKNLQKACYSQAFYTLLLTCLPIIFFCIGLAKALETGEFSSLVSSGNILVVLFSFIGFSSGLYLFTKKKEALLLNGVIFLSMPIFGFALWLLFFQKDFEISQTTLVTYALRILIGIGAIRDYLKFEREV